MRGRHGKRPAEGDREFRGRAHHAFHHVIAHPALEPVTHIVLDQDEGHSVAGEPRFEGNLLPLILVIVAACIWAFCSVQIKRLGDAIDVLALNAWVAVLAMPQLALVSWIFEEGQVAAVREASWLVWAAIAYQAVLVMVLGYGVWYTMMRRYPVNQVMPFTLLVPVFGVLSGVIFFDDQLTVTISLDTLCTVATFPCPGARTRAVLRWRICASV